MINIQIVGPGCENCRKVADLCIKAIAELGVKANIEKITEIKKFADLGIFITPGVMINNIVKSYGKIPTKPTIKHWIQQAGQENKKSLKQ